MPHTPGKWTVEDRRKAPLKNIRIVSDDHEICWVSDVHQRDLLAARSSPNFFDGSKEAEAAADAIDELGIANARLIAAAPELLKCGERALSILEEAVEIGGGDPKTHHACANLRAAIAKAKGGAQ